MQQNQNHLQFVRRIAAVAIDDRERNSRVKAELECNENVKVTVKRLPLGDYQIENSLIVERKTLADFALSVRNGRLFAQVSRLVRSKCERPCLILEGTAKRYPRLAIPRTSFQGALITVMVVFGLPVLRSRDAQETARMIVYAADQLQNRRFRPPRRCGFKTTTIRRHQLLLLQAVPEIGGWKAERLLEAFSSPAGVAGATVDELRRVDGIGEVAAERVYEVFHHTERKV